MSNIIIIGASSGIGHALAKLYASKDYVVAVMARRHKLLEELSKNFPNQIKAYPLDIRDMNNCIDMLGHVSAQLGRIDVIINCAGVVEDNSTLKLSIEMNTIDTNVKGFVTVSTWAYNLLKLQNGGVYAVVTSIFGARGRRLAPSYNASKAFQINYLEGLRQKARNEKLSVSLIDLRVGFVKTQMVAEDTGLLPIISKDKAAKLISNAITRRNSISFIPFYWFFLNMVLKLMPNKLYEKL